MRVLRILVADDHAVVRSGIRQFLADTPDLAIAGEAASAHEAMTLARAGEWDLLLLDINLPDGNGLEVLKRIRRELPALPVLIFSMFSEDEYAVSALRAGAAGYVSKDSAPEQILEAIRRVGGGGRYVSPALAEKLLAGTLGGGKQWPHDRLSAREFEVMILLSRGVSLTELARRLRLSVKTVSTYRSRILEKLALGSNAELARYVIEHRLDT